MSKYQKNPDINLNPVNNTELVITNFPEFYSFIPNDCSSFKERAISFSIHKSNNQISNAVDLGFCKLVAWVFCQVAGGSIACYSHEYCAGSIVLEYQFSTQGRQSACQNRSSVG